MAYADKAFKTANLFLLVSASMAALAGAIFLSIGHGAAVGCFIAAATLGLLANHLGNSPVLPPKR